MSANRNRVRIIAGRYRRRLLSFPDADGLRPTPDRVRETLFNWLGQELDGLRCLDLFAGSGALGFEAASRGARRVVMVEKAKAPLMALKANRQELGANEIDVVAMDSMMYLKNCREQFDLILLDPPFDADLLPVLLPKIRPFLAENGALYIEGRTLPELADWQVERQGKAGVVHYALLRARPDTAPI